MYTEVVATSVRLPDGSYDHSLVRAALLLGAKAEFKTASNYWHSADALMEGYLDRFKHDQFRAVI